MMGFQKPKPPPPAKPQGLGMKPATAEKPYNASFAAAKALFEAAKNPEVRNAAVAASKNPLVRNVAKSAAQDPKTRQLVMESLIKQQQASQPTPPPKHDDTPPPPVPRHTATNYNSSTTNYNSSPLPPKDYGTKPSTDYSKPRTYGGSSTPASVYPSLNQELAALNIGKASAPSRPAPAQNRNIASPTKESYAVVLYPYTGTQFDELTCEAGDKVLLKREVDDQWIYGMNTRTGLHGIVPIGYLDVKVPMAPTQSAQGSSTIKSTYNPNADDGFVYPYSDSALNITTALYDYNSTESGDLSFHAGDPLCIIEWINDDWLRGECAGRKGIFPANFVDLSTLGTIPRSTPSGSTAGQAGAKETVTVAYDYDSGVADDLVCRAGDVLEVVEHVNAEWIKARSHGKTGLVPTTYLQMSVGSATVSKSVEMEKEMTAVADYTSTEAGHLVASKGDKILIVEEVDEHWYRGKLADSAFRRMPPGLIPKSFVQ